LEKTQQVQKYIIQTPESKIECNIVIFDYSEML